MDNVFIDLTHIDWIKKYTGDADFVTVEKLIDIIEELDDEVYNLKDKIKELENADGEDPDAYDKWFEYHHYHEE